MARSFSGVGTALAALGVTLSAGMFVKFASDGIKAMAVLHDLADVSGITVESLSSMTEVAKLSGTDLETVAASAGKLSKAMLEVAATGKGKAAQAFTDLGISVTDSLGKLRDSDQVMQEVAKKLFGMESATQRVAYAQLLFGKEGAKLLPFLRELAEAGTLAATATTAQAAAADRFEDSLVKLGTATTKLKIAFANDLLPWLNNVTEAMIRGQKEGGGLTAVIAGIQAAVAGTDRHRNNVELMKDTENLLRLENELAQATGSNDTKRVGQLGALQAKKQASLRQEIADTKSRIDTHMAFRKVQEEGDAAEAATEKRRKDALKNVPITSGKGAGKPETRAIEGFLKSLDDEVIKKGNILRITEVTKALEDKRFDTATKGEKEKAIAQASILDSLAAEEIHLKRITEELITATTETERLKKLDEEREKILANMAQTATDRMHAADTVDWSEAAKDLNAKLQEGTKWAQEMGLTFTSAFEDAVTGGKGFRDVLDGIIKDIAKIAIRKTVTEPLGAGISGLFSGGGPEQLGGPTGGGFMDFFKNLFPRAATGMDYVPHDMLVNVHKGETISRAGQGGGVNVSITIDARGGTDPGAMERMRASIDRDIVPKVVDAVRRGGSARRFMGA